MQTIIFDTEIKRKIISCAESVSKRIFLFSAYCKEQLMAELCASSSSKEGLEAVLVVRWQMEDLVNGSSDLEVYNITKKYGWKMYINEALHAKIFIFDNDVVLGSANLTNRGTVGEDLGGNIEVCTNISVDAKVNFWSKNTIENSCLLDDELFAEIFNEVEEAKRNISECISPPHSFSSQIRKLIKYKFSKCLYVKDLFWLKSPGILLDENYKTVDRSDIDHDLSLLRLDGSKVQLEKLKKKFEKSKAFLWLNNTVIGEIYFGELSARLHKSLQDDPAPYRKDVKVLLQNLINWIDFLYPDKFLIDRPNHSQRIKSIF